MSLNSILELVLQLDSFRNVDLLKQGLYQVQVSCYTRSNSPDSPLNLAQPYEVTSLGPPNKTMAIQPAQINDQAGLISSSTVLIRYCDEEMKMNDCGVFRLEVEFGCCWEVVVEAKLLFSDLNGALDFESPLRQVQASGHQIDYIELSRTSLILTNPCEGIQQYSEFLFAMPHMCVIGTTLHVMLMDHRLRVITPLSDLELPKAMAKYLFSNQQTGQMKVFAGSDETDRKYALLIAGLASCHAKLRQFLVKLIEKCEGADMKELPELVLPMYRAPFTAIIPKKFSEAVSSHDPAFISSALMTEITLIAGQMCQLFHVLRGLLKAYPGAVLGYMRDQYKAMLRERCGESIFRDSHLVQHCELTGDNELAERHKVQSTTQRHNQYYLSLTPLPVHNPFLFPPPDLHPILFEDNYSPALPVPMPTQRPANDHVIVLVHGYQGTPMDMRVVRNAISLVYPAALVMISSCNEGQTEGCILEMGKSLAKEVEVYVEEWCPNGKLGRISFIAHSLGGLIVRAALPYMSEFTSKLHSFISLSCPHLGYMYSSSRLVEAGMWVLKAWSRALCLKQLSMSEEEDRQQTVLYRLAGYPGLGWFKHVVLLSSYQDLYVPFESARIEVSPKAANDPINGKAYMEMATRMLGSLLPSQLCRLDVSFKIASKGIDTLIGRTAHIQFIENEGLLRLLAYRYPDFFL